jgi:hypothetical protein
MAKEYIERDAVLEAIESTDWYHLSEKGNMVHGAVSGENAWYKADDIYKVLEEIPAADVVEVVRCKDCKYLEEAYVNAKGFLFCPASGMEVTDMDFCSYGKRRDNDDL